MLAIWTAYAVEPLVLQIPRRSFTRLRLMSDFEDLSHENLLSKWVEGIWTGLQSSDAGDPRDPGNCLESYRPSWNITRPSYFDSGLDEEPPRRYTLQVDTDKLLDIAGPAGRLIVSWTTGGPKRWSIAQNLALSIRRNTPELEPIFVFIALDADAVRRARDSGFNAVLNDGSGDLQDDIWKMRWLIQTTCVSLGLEVLVVDSDIVFLADPFRHFFFDSDVEAMTDHFFPAEQLWATWLRPAEHINTGFLFVRPSARLLAFLVEFIDVHYHGHEGPTPRDGMDQRVFNKFVMHKMEKSPPEVVSRYENITFSGLDWQGKTRRFTPRATWEVPIGSSDTITIRILDPVCISHGMNYFWRKAYKLKSCDGSGQPPAVVHVNGVDPKMYFLRDRNLWYVNDWDDRFNDSTSFLVYHHPKGLNLSADFEVLIAALEIGAYFRRRVVLPDTMNCANSPAYLIYNLSETMVDEPGCTYDYFAHANGLYEVYSRVKPYAIEAGIAREPRFKELSIQRLRGSLQLREELLSAHAERRAAFPSARVLEVDDIILLRDGLRSGSFGLRMNPEHVFSCAFQEPLIGAMACLDEPYVEEFGAEAMCEAQSFVKGCGPVGICCCWPFWGWGEKLQYFTGVKWDLPCNCGVSVCETFSRRLDSGSENCCRHAGSTALFPVTDPGVFYCETNFSWSGPTGAEDPKLRRALVEFAANKRTVQQSFQTCSTTTQSILCRCAGPEPYKTAAQQAEDAAEQEAKETAAREAMQEFDEKGNPTGPPGWPFGIRPEDKEVWTPKDVEELKRRLPAYNIKGPGVRAICWGQGELVGARLRLIKRQRGVHSVEEAAQICDDLEGCTHFSIRVGPDFPMTEDIDLDKGIPYRAEFCRGPMVTTVDFPRTHSFVGIKKYAAREGDLPPPENNEPPIPLVDGPLEAFGRDQGYFAAYRSRLKRIEERERLDRLKSATHQLEMIKKEKTAKDVRAKLKSMQSFMPLLFVPSKQARSKACQKLRSEWVFEQRRSLGNASRLIASMEGSMVTDNTGFSFGKLAHDTEQLEYIISIGREELHEAASGFRSLLELFAQLQKGAPVREEVAAQFAKVRPFFNRALHLPDLDQSVGEVTEFLPAAADWEGASLDVRTRGVAIIRGALTASAQKLVRRWLLESTVWYQSLQNGDIQKSQLRDGLHGPVGFRLVHEIQARLPNLLGKLPLLDITSYRHGQQSSGLPWHCLDGIVVAMFWFGSISDSALEVSGRNSSMSFCSSNRVGPAPALQLEGFTREQAPTPARSLACPEGCLLLWQAAHAIRTIHRAKVDTFASRPVELLLLFGNYVDAGAKAAGFMPSFEGKADSWGEHYYARDHDHR
ncbi:unnamed protein product [Symbiodinium sp. KB8]|nr:unnamed protein product [Symbiodinium sp. KB8]